MKTIFQEPSSQKNEDSKMNFLWYLWLNTLKQAKRGRSKQIMYLTELFNKTTVRKKHIANWYLVNYGDNIPISVNIYFGPNYISCHQNLSFFLYFNVTMTLMDQFWVCTMVLQSLGSVVNSKIYLIFKVRQDVQL